MLLITVEPKFTLIVPRWSVASEAVFPAIPLLGTGNAGLPADVCLDTLFRALARALHGGGSGVREASIVLWSRPRT